MINVNASILAYATQIAQSGDGPVYRHAFAPLSGPLRVPASIDEPSTMHKQTLTAAGIDDAKVIRCAATALRFRGVQRPIAGDRVRMQRLGDAAPDGDEGWYKVIEVQETGEARHPGSLNWLQLTVRPARDGTEVAPFTGGVP